MKKLVLMFVVLLSLGGSLTGCSNTLDGFGKDMEEAGRGMQKTF